MKGEFFLVLLYTLGSPSPMVAIPMSSEALCLEAAAKVKSEFVSVNPMYIRAICLRARG